MLINANILESSHNPGGAPRLKIEKVISCFSTCVFPDKVTYPLDENKVHSGPPHDSNCGYAHAKRMVDVYNHAYTEEFGMNFTSAIPTNVFGPHDDFDLEDSHVIPGLIHKTYKVKIGEDEEVSIEEVAKAITRAFGIEGQYKFDTSRADGQFRKPATNAKLLSLVGSDLKFTPFDEALQETVDWFLQNYETARTGKKWTR
ncbi:hypothetical protein FRC00_007404, partial [Tulasnella sp. 408]